MKVSSVFTLHHDWDKLLKAFLCCCTLNTEFSLSSVRASLRRHYNTAFMFTAKQWGTERRSSSPWIGQTFGHWLVYWLLLSLLFVKRHGNRRHGDLEHRQTGQTVDFTITSSKECHKFPRWLPAPDLDEFFFWHSHSEVEMTETAGDHRAQLEVKTLQRARLNDLQCGTDVQCTNRSASLLPSAGSHTGQWRSCSGLGL